MVYIVQDGNENMVDTSKSLEQLVDASLLPTQSGIGSHIEVEFHRLKKIPIREFTVEDLRLIILQNICPEILVPLALDFLEENPLVAGAYYRGDLLAAVLHLPDDFWVNHPVLNNRLVEVKTELEVIFETVRDNLLPLIAARDYCKVP